ncbi:MAG: MFS transporter [Armatimonadota bacterium]
MKPDSPRETRADRRWNFGAALIDACGWNTGVAFISHLTILPLFVKQLTPSPVAIGMIPALMLFGWLVPGVLVASRIERLRNVRYWVLGVGLLERLMLLVLAVLCWGFSESRSALLLAFFGCWLVMNLALGANLPAYYKLIAKTIPAARRGRLYGLGGAAAGVLGLGCAVLAERFIGAWGFPNGYAACFLAAFVIQTVTLLPLGVMREVIPEEHEIPPPEPVRKALSLVRRDSRILWLCIGVALFALNQMAGAFYTDFAITGLGASERTVAEYNQVLNVGRAVTYLLIGWLADRYGNLRAIQLATFAGLGAVSLAWGADGPLWMHPVFLLNELALQGWAVCAQNYVLELCPPQRSGTYTAVFNLFSGPFRVLLPLAAGSMISAVGFSPIFAAGAVGTALALGLVLWRLPEPRAG